MHLDLTVVVLLSFSLSAILFQEQPELASLLLASLITSKWPLFLLLLFFPFLLLLLLFVSLLRRVCYFTQDSRAQVVLVSQVPRSWDLRHTLPPLTKLHTTVDTVFLGRLTLPVHSFRVNDFIWDQLLQIYLMFSVLCDVQFLSK